MLILYLAICYIIIEGVEGRDGTVDAKLDIDQVSSRLQVTTWCVPEGLNSHGNLIHTI